MALPFLDLLAKQVLFEIFQTGSLIHTVARDWANDVQTEGKSVTVIMPETPAVQDAGSTFSATAVSPTTATITLNKWRETAPLKVDMASVAKADRNVLAMYASPIATALVADVEASILTTAATLAGSTGTVTTGTALPSSIANFFTYKSKFDSLSAPDNDRYVISGPELEGAYMGLFGLQSNSGDPGVAEQINGQIGKRLGMNFVANQNAFNGTSKLIGYGYHRNAIGLASRPMQPSPLAPQTMATVDHNGIGITLELWHDPNTSADYIRGQILYGLALVSSKGFKIYKA